MNPKTISYALVIGISLIICGCEGSVSASGIVLDKTTLHPLDSVYCVALTSDDKMITDNTGRFSLTNPISGCFPKCKEIIIQLSKKGYKAVMFTNPSDTIFYLER